MMGLITQYYWSAGGERHDEKQQAKSKKIMHVFFWFGLLVVVDNKQ